MPWVALTLEIERAASEALSDALLEAGAASVALDGPDEQPPSLNALFASTADIPAALAQAVRAAGLADLPRYSIAEVQDQDWVRRSQAQFQPVRIGERLWVGPTWHEPPADAGTVVRIDPGLAFGTGSHPTTKLVLDFLLRNLHGGERVLDYGCGSGILAIAAAKLGAACAVGVDVDPEA